MAARDYLIAFGMHADQKTPLPLPEGLHHPSALHDIVSAVHQLASGTRKASPTTTRRLTCDVSGVPIDETGRRASPFKLHQWRESWYTCVVDARFHADMYYGAGKEPSLRPGKATAERATTFFLATAGVLLVDNQFSLAFELMETIDERMLQDLSFQTDQYLREFTWRADRPLDCIPFQVDNERYRAAVQKGQAHEAGLSASVIKRIKRASRLAALARVITGMRCDFTLGGYGMVIATHHSRLIPFGEITRKTAIRIGRMLDMAVTLLYNIYRSVEGGKPSASSAVADFQTLFHGSVHTTRDLTSPLFRIPVALRGLTSIVATACAVIVCVDLALAPSLAIQYLLSDYGVQCMIQRVDTHMEGKVFAFLPDEKGDDDRLLSELAAWKATGGKDPALMVVGGPDETGRFREYQARALRDTQRFPDWVEDITMDLSAEEFGHRRRAGESAQTGTVAGNLTHGAGGKKKHEDRFQKKVHIVMKEFEQGKLRSSSGKPVTDHRQAVAIALSEARRYTVAGNVTHGAGGKKHEDRFRKKVHIVMKEFEQGKLRTSSGKPVTDHGQAVAIALSEARRYTAK